MTLVSLKAPTIALSTIGGTLRTCDSRSIRFVQVQKHGKVNSSAKINICWTLDWTEPSIAALRYCYDEAYFFYHKNLLMGFAIDDFKRCPAWTSVCCGFLWPYNFFSPSASVHVSCGCI